tara:strand:- start:15582 stop:16355 length:774 start_codon:yes stop_codon:yes gene_type:complete
MPRKKQTEETSSVDNSIGPNLFQRDENGLLKNIQYDFNEDGSVNWRSMIREEYLFPNKSWFELRKKDVPRSIDGLKDHQLLIKLGGIKELARLRGFTAVHFYTEKCEADHVAVTCTIDFIKNYETGESVSFQDMANATVENTSSFAKKFLETIACNRAFVRCVRNFLNVHIVGDDEIDKSDTKQASSAPASMSPISFLKGVLQDKYGAKEYEEFLDIIRPIHKEGKLEKISVDTIKSWKSFDDISAKDARILLGVLK